MKTRSCNFAMFTILLFSLIFGLSCSNDSDLLADAVLSDSVVGEGVVVNDYFVVRDENSIILNVLSNDGFSEDDDVQITEISSATYGSVEINEDNISIVYTPYDLSEDNETGEEGETQAEEETTGDDEETQDEDDTAEVEEESQDEEAVNEDTVVEEVSETTDTFTYTTEVVNEDETTSTEVGTVEVVIETAGDNDASEDENTEQETEEDANSSDDNSSEEEDSGTEENNGTTDEEDTTTENTNNHSAKLIFSSGFEGVSLSNQKNDYRYITGTDSNTGFSWPPKILGSTGNESEPSGIHTINDGGQATISNRLETVVGHKGNQTTALYQGINGTAGVTQTPYQINNIKENPDELYISYWMKIDNTSLSGAHKWRALWEYKTDNYGSGGGFRMIAFIYTDSNGKAYWNFQGDRNPSNAVWEKPNFDIPVPREEWFKVEYFFKWSEGSDGRAFMKVNGQLVGEHHGPTTANSKNIDFIILTQVYGDTSPMHQWVDDIEIWDGLPY